MNELKAACIINHFKPFYIQLLLFFRGHRHHHRRRLLFHNLPQQTDTNRTAIKICYRNCIVRQSSVMPLLLFTLQ